MSQSSTAPVSMPQADLPQLAAALTAGKRVLLHDFGADKTRQVLQALKLPGEVSEVKSPDTAAGPRRRFRRVEIDPVRHFSRLADGITCIDICGIARSASISLPQSDTDMPLTRSGAAAVYAVNGGTLVIDNLQWQSSDIRSPERLRRYLTCLLTNLGVPLAGK